ncbi:RIO kinase 1 [Microbacterium terrae]|uniref:non-specific serine/threonine protein kinase n=1 Tax=Microbacterium terrae TaxID=69369 RepID=A0A0M2HE54_9MICO|nr:RIO1 family regulatory kinase/ATPase [Microbacterium terrae]KJL44919.1 RIO1 family protein [Microbacterium terrae]MBP1076745.1 RIO kinase 1 [Microbacterium terrae]GLJ97576.1 RIO kinase 1 [Microbacterium terrae]
MSFLLSDAFPPSDPLRFDEPDDDLPEPGPDQRWSTWPASPPTQRGPLPHPDWVVTASGAFDTELGVVKTGKEADVFLIERAVPGEGGALLAAKRYRSAHHSDFHRSGTYEEGRTVRNTRDARAIERKTAYGRRVAATHWAGSEFAALVRAWEAGVPVPYPVQVSESEVLMEFVGDGRTAAPRLAQSRLHGDELKDAFGQVVRILEAFARGGFAHGDLSPYNLLDHHGRIVVIDLPQVVDIAANPQGLEFLHRDVVNVSAWFTRRGLVNDPEELFGGLVSLLW